MTLSVESLLAIGSALVVVVAWLVRLEAKGSRNAERLDDFKVQCRDDFDELKHDFRDFRGGPIHIDRLPSREQKP